MVGDRAHAAGASKSLNQTISDVMDFLEDGADRPAVDLRAFLYEKLGDLSEHWYRKGFNRGHRQSYKKFEAKGKVPVKLSYSCERNLFHDDARELRLRSKVKHADQ